jgi:hypothetical protein
MGLIIQKSSESTYLRSACTLVHLRKIYPHISKLQPIFIIQNMPRITADKLNCAMQLPFDDMDTGICNSSDDTLAAAHI